MAEPTKLWSTDLGLPADCVEFCPVRPNLFAVGMYKLDEEAGERQGALATFLWHGGADVQQLHHSGSLPGVLDLKWKDDILAGAFSDGTVQLCRLREERLEPETSCQAASCLALAVAWAPGGDKLAVSCSDGSVSILSRDSASLESVAEIQCHSFEAWSVVWDAVQPHIFYTGGDDCRFCCWDERSPGQAVRTLRRHSMGVTAIAPHPHMDHVLASGSYDEQVLLWDTRSFSKPLAEGQAGGRCLAASLESGPDASAAAAGCCCDARRSMRARPQLCGCPGACLHLHRSPVHGVRHRLGGRGHPGFMFLLRQAPSAVAARHNARVIAVPQIR
ncbi:hypothetical protein MTO96_035381 [Rhipicephalus appendiculatus]